MDYENFKEQLMEEVKADLYEKGFEVNVASHNVDKLNESYDAITITPVNSNIGMNMNVSQMFERMENGRDFQDVVDMTIDTATKHLGDMPEVDVDQLTNYEQMKSKLAIEVVSHETNAEMLSKIPHQEMEDMAVVYHFVPESNEDGRSSILVTNKLLENMGVTPEQLHADAIANAPLIRPAEIKGMSQVMMEMMGLEHTHEPRMLFIEGSNIYTVDRDSTKKKSSEVTYRKLTCCFVAFLRL
jgi:galactitol-specific phosphotransferase system IIB component